MVANHVCMGLSCMAAGFQQNKIDKQKRRQSYGYLNRESWAGKEKVILALLKPLKIFFDYKSIPHKINHGKIVKQMVIL